MFHSCEAGRDVAKQREGCRGQAKRLFLSDVVSFLSRIFRKKRKQTNTRTDRHGETGGLIRAEQTDGRVN